MTHGKHSHWLSKREGASEIPQQSNKTVISDDRRKKIDTQHDLCIVLQKPMW